MNRSNQRGVTRFELTVVTAAAGVVALLGLLIVKPQLAAAETDEAEKHASRIHTAAEEWRRDNGNNGCPTLSQLVHERRLSESARTDDPWGERYRLRCTDEEVTVVSPGQDREPNTKDDIRVPRSAS